MRTAWEPCCNIWQAKPYKTMQKPPSFRFVLLPVVSHPHWQLLFLSSAVARAYIGLRNGVVRFWDLASQAHRDVTLLATVSLSHTIWHCTSKSRRIDDMRKILKTLQFPTRFEGDHRLWRRCHGRQGSGHSSVWHSHRLFGPPGRQRIRGRWVDDCHDCHDLVMIIVVEVVDVLSPLSPFSFFFVTFIFTGFLATWQPAVSFWNVFDVLRAGRPLSLLAFWRGTRLGPPPRHRGCFTEICCDATGDCAEAGTLIVVRCYHRINLWRFLYWNNRYLNVSYTYWFMMHTHIYIYNYTNYIYIYIIYIYWSRHIPYTCGSLWCPKMQNAWIPCRNEIIEVVPFESISLCFPCFWYWVRFCVFHFKMLRILWSWVLEFPSSAFLYLNVAYPMGSVFCLRCSSWYFLVALSNCPSRAFLPYLIC